MFKDYLHLYTVIVMSPIVAAIAYAKIFIGEATYGPNSPRKVHFF